jgi:hypothetical protein
VSNCGAIEARERFLKAFIEKLNSLKVLTVGLSKVAAEEAASRVLGELRLEASDDEAASVRELLSTFGAEAEVSVGAEELHVKVSACPFSLAACDRFCPLPYVAAVHLSSKGARWSPKREGQYFVKKEEGSCAFTLVKVPRELAEVTDDQG